MNRKNFTLSGISILMLFFAFEAKSQNVGIGTTTPESKLEIYHNSSLTDAHIQLHENDNDYSKIRFQNNNGTNYWSLNVYTASNIRNDRVNFWNGESGDLLSLTGDGRLGLNVGFSPKTQFHVGNNNRVLFGTDTIGNGDKLMFLPDLHAFRVGTVDAGTTSTYWNRDSIGLYSFASGYNTRAQGFGATAMGRGTEATNFYAFASGYFTNADGQFSTAMGYNTDAFGTGSVALGYNTDAEQGYAFAAGYYSEAQAIYSVAIGDHVRAQSYASIAVGRYNLGGGNATSWLGSSPLFEIGNGTSNTNRSNAMTVLKNGKVGIGTTTPNQDLHVNGVVRIGSVEDLSDGGNFLLLCNSTFAPAANNTGNLGSSSLRWNTIYATNGTINTSDRRDKENIRQMKYGLAEIMRMEPVSFTWKRDAESRPKLGLIAQDLKKIISEVVVDTEWQTDEKTGMRKQGAADRLGVFYSDLIPVLIKGMQEQQEQIMKLKNQLQEHVKEKERLDKLEIEIETIKQLLAEWDEKK